MRETRTAESGVVSRDGSFSRHGSFYRMWIIRLLAMMLVAFSVFLGACNQGAQPAEEQPAEEEPAGQQVPQEEEGEED